MAYLTEDNLGNKLALLFPKSEIIHNARRGVDYVVIDRLENFPQKMQDIINDDLEVSAFFDTEYEEYEEVEKVKLFIEYDGNRHFIGNKQPKKDVRSGMGFCKLQHTGVAEFGIRIPYFVQLDARMISHLFDINDVDYSDGFPHGFISNKVVLPETFSRAGEKAFRSHMLNLPKDIATEVYLSLLNKVKMPKRSSPLWWVTERESYEAVCSDPLWVWLSMRFDEKVINIVENTLKASDWHSTDKYYKYMDEKDMNYLTINGYENYRWAKIGKCDENYRWVK